MIQMLIQDLWSVQSRLLCHNFILKNCLAVYFFINEKKNHFLLKYCSDPVHSYFYLSHGVESVLSLLRKYILHKYTHYYLSTKCALACFYSKKKLTS